MTDPMAAQGLPRVRLRPLSVDDLDVHAAGSDELVNRWTNDGYVSDLRSHRTWLEGRSRAWDEGADEVDLAVEDADTGTHVGVVGIQRGLDVLELTYTVYAAHRGKGYATAATRAAMELAVSQAPVARFVIRCDPDNTPSAAVAVRLGFECLGPVTEPDGWCGIRYVRGGAEALRGRPAAE